MSHAESVGPKHPRLNLLLSLLLVGLLLGIQAVSGYHSMFWMFAPQDDEGHVMAPIDQVCQGKVLGDDVYCNFGPAYVFTYAGFFRLTGLGVTHDAMRLITLGLWLLVAGVCWFTCFRITRRAIVSMLVCYGAFRCAQIPFVCEPGHPQEIIALGLVLVPAVAAALLPARKGCFSFLAGAILGYVLMCKVNVGLFGLGGLALALVAATSGPLARTMKWGLVAAAVAAPTLLIWRHLDTEAGSRLADVATLAFAAALAQIVARRSNGFALTHWGWAALGCVGAVAAGCGVALLSGTSFHALGEITFLNAVRHAEVHFDTFTLGKIALIISVLSCAASLIVAFSAAFGKWRSVSSTLEWMIRLLLVGGTLWFFRPFSLFSFPYALVVPMYEFGLPLFWIGLVPVGAPILFQHPVVRNVSVLIAVFHALVVYPVSGTQVALACLLFVLIWGFAVHDTLVGLAAILPAKGSTLALRPIVAGVVTLAVLVDGLCYLRHVANARQEEIPLALPGAARLRLDEPQAAIFRFLAANLNQPGRTFLTMPGMYSLYFWAQKVPPTGLNASDWMAMLSDRQQQQVVESVQGKEDLWAVVWPREALKRVGPRYIEDQPLVKFILSECRRVNAVGNVELWKRGRGGSAELVQCVHWGILDEPQPQKRRDWLQLVCRVPIAHSYASPLGAITVVDPMKGRILASSHPLPGCEGVVALLVPADAPGQSRQFTRFPPLDIDAGQDLCFTMRFPRSPGNEDAPGAILPGRQGRWTNKGIVVRLQGPPGPSTELLDAVPFLADADLARIPQPPRPRFRQSPQ